MRAIDPNRDEPHVEIYGEPWYLSDLVSLKELTEDPRYELLHDFLRAEVANATDEMIHRPLDDGELRETRGFVRGLRQAQLVPASVDVFIEQIETPDASQPFG